ncbi:ATP-binding protein [Streptomyces sp. NPDC049954]|uniref:ATP-binding protein n=1 Tax=Streptomyces sp. NPDC049954 TaxID=3155779 RepID=UPI0034188A27
MNGFIGRDHELGLLRDLLSTVRAGGRTGRPGRAVLVRGRRRVGKSRLIEEFVGRAGVPHLFFTAVGGSRGEDLAGFLAEASRSALPEAARLQDFPTPRTWDAALDLVASALPTDRPSVVVLDEMPCLVRDDPAFEGALQKVFDRTLSRLPVLLVLIGSDLAMMEKLNTYGRPFYQRGTEMVVPPLNPADVSAMLRLPAAEAFDAYLVSGGLPLVLEEWEPGTGLWDYLGQALRRPTSALLVSGERALAAEFPGETQARGVLGAIGNGERTFTLIRRAAGDIPATSLTRSLGTLTDRRLVAAELPLSTRPSRETRYRIEDSYLRFWLSFVGPGIPAVERGRGDRVLNTVRAGWTSWRGRAVEPVVREALWRLGADDGLLPPGTDVVGGYWTRTNDPEIDLVGADRSPVAKRISVVGSVKWLEDKPFDGRDLSRLVAHRAQLPGADDTTPLLAVARSGCVAGGDVRHLGPQELLGAWTSG